MITQRSRVHAVHNPLRIRVAPTAAEARRLLRRGFCPVECSFGSESVVDRLEMDHHGPRSDLPPVAVRAYRSHFGAREHRPWFVVTGCPDEDATWAIGSLAGLLPHPDHHADLHAAPLEIQRAWARDWSSLADLIGRADVDLASLDLPSTTEGQLLLLWRLRGSFPLQDPIAFYAGIDRWRALLTQSSAEELALVPGLLEIRLRRTRRLRHEQLGHGVVIVDSALWGFSSVYAQDWFRRYRARLLFVFQPRPNGRGIVTVCARDERTAKRMYGEQGLLAVFPRLRPRGWGGRPAIGGSHRGKPITYEQAREAARQAATLVL